MSTRASKRARYRRSSTTVVAITDRDIELLTFVALSAYVSIEQIARELFPSLDRARRRARALFDAGYLMRWHTPSTMPGIYSVTARGCAVLREARPVLAARIRPSRPHSYVGVEHHLGLVDMRCFAAALGELRRTPLIEWSNAGGELARRLGLDRFGLRPDGVAAFQTPDGGTYAIACEYDASTEAIPVLADKLDRYAKLAHAGILDALWIGVPQTGERLSRIARLVIERGLGDWVRLGSRAELVARPPQPLARAAQIIGQPNNDARHESKGPYFQDPLRLRPALDRGSDRGTDRAGNSSHTHTQDRRP